MISMVNYDKLIIYYFSGTGNARRAAEWIIDVAKEKGIETELINIEKIKDNNSYEFKNKTLIGFCFPTHGFNTPPIVVKFLRKFPKNLCADVFLLNTRAGMKLYKIFTPGLSGVAQIVPAIILKLKGYKIIGFRPLDLPSNWISIHPGLRKKVVDSIFKRCERITRKFADKILRRKKIYRGLYSLPIDIAISPISVAYYFFGRFMIAKTFIATDSCNNCGLCVKNCPLNAISIINDRPYWSFNCESCMRCMNNCPQRAIETAHSYVALLWWIAFSFVPYFVLKLIIENDILKVSYNTLESKILANILMIVFGFAIIYLGYKILHFLMKFKYFNKLIAYTSLTKYKFWRRYKAPLSRKI